MIDWNNDGKIEADDIILTEMMLEDEEEESKGSNFDNKPNGSCFTSFLLLIMIPTVLVITAISLI